VQLWRDSSTLSRLRARLRFRISLVSLSEFLNLFSHKAVYSDADPMFSKEGSQTLGTPLAGSRPDLKKFSLFKSPEANRHGLTSAGGNIALEGSHGKTMTGFYKRKDDAQKRAAADLEETLSHFTSVSQKGPIDYFAKSKLMNRAKSNSQQAQDVKVYHPVGFSAKKMYVSKDAPAQHQ
jgi:hypothetical protein